MRMAKRSVRFYMLTALLCAAIAFIGCGGGGGGSSDGGDDGVPVIGLSSYTIAFGNVVVGQTAERSVTVQNIGTANLNIGAITPPTAPFSIVAGKSTCSNQIVAPGGSCSLVVGFTPNSQGDNQLGSLIIPSNDSNETIAFSGNGKGLNVAINRVDTSDLSNIKLIVSVTDSSNNPVTTLDELDFSVLVNGNGQPIISVLPASTEISAALDLDSSDSMEEAEDYIEAAAQSFLDYLNLTDRAAVIRFADNSQLMIDFTPISGKQAIRDAIDPSLYVGLGNATILYDAVYETVDRLLAEGNRRLCTLVLSDGNDLRGEGLASTRSLDEVIAHAQESGVFIFTIGLQGSYMDPINTAVMQRMAAETGGQYFEAPDWAALEPIYQKISVILSNQYEIVYTPTTPAADGTAKILKVIATDGALSGDDSESVTY